MVYAVNLRCTVFLVPRPLTPEEIDKFRSELCEVATRLFAEKGFGGVTLRALAGELGCSPMTPYRYFANKEDVFRSVRLAAFRRLTQRVSAAAAGSGPCPLERIRALGHAYVRFALDEPHAYRIMFQLERTWPGEVREVMEELEVDELRSGWQVLCDAMDDAVRAGKLAGEPTQLAHFSWVSLHGCVTLHLAEKLELGLSLEDLVDPLLDHFFRGSSPLAPARSGDR